MHYKNGREAKDGDTVIYYDTYRQKTFGGVVWAIIPGSNSCNCQVARVVPGLVVNESKTLGEMYHAEDALMAIEPNAIGPKAI